MDKAKEITFHAKTINPLQSDDLMGMQGRILKMRRRLWIMVVPICLSVIALWVYFVFTAPHTDANLVIAVTGAMFATFAANFPFRFWEEEIAKPEALLEKYNTDPYMKTLGRD